MTARKIQATLRALGLTCGRCAGGIEVKGRNARCFCTSWKEALEYGISMFEREMVR